MDWSDYLSIAALLVSVAAFFREMALDWIRERPTQRPDIELTGAIVEKINDDLYKCRIELTNLGKHPAAPLSVLTGTVYVADENIQMVVIDDSAFETPDGLYPEQYTELALIFRPEHEGADKVVVCIEGKYRDKWLPKKQFNDEWWISWKAHNSRLHNVTTEEIRTTAPHIENARRAYKQSRKQP